MITADKLQHAAACLQTAAAERKEACVQEQKAIDALKTASEQRRATEVRYNESLQEYWRLGHGFESAEEMTKAHDAEEATRERLDADRRHAQTHACGTSAN